MTLDGLVLRVQDGAQEIDKLVVDKIVRLTVDVLAHENDGLTPDDDDDDDDDDDFGDDDDDDDDTGDLFDDDGDDGSEDEDA